MRTTFHLVAQAEWEAGDVREAYRHPSLDDEGFIHCTDRATALRDTANRYYRDDPRPFLALTIDLDAAGSPWRIDVPGTPYPHIYGPVARRAIVGVQPMPRADDGTFLGPGARPGSRVRRPERP